MKPYMSYWSGGYKKTPSKDTINMHAVGAYFLKKNFHEVHLITDSESLPYLRDVGFSSISTDLDILPKEYGSTWSLGKLYAYKIISQKGDPFFHIDYDAILWEDLPKAIKNADVFAQCHEAEYYDSYQVNHFLKNCPNLYLAKHFPTPERAINVGIIGGNDLEFLYNYSNSALELVFDA